MKKSTSASGKPEHIMSIIEREHPKLAEQVKKQALNQQHVATTLRIEQQQGSETPIAIPFQWKATRKQWQQQLQQQAATALATAAMALATVAMALAIASNATQQQ